MSELAYVTASDLTAFLRCPHTIVRKRNAGKMGQRTTEDPLQTALREHGNSHEKKMIALRNWPTPGQGQTHSETHSKTFTLMREGVPGLTQAVLHHPPLHGRPDLLRKVDGASLLGDFHYEPGDIKSSQKARGDQIAQVVFYALLLEHVQGRRPDHGFLILADGSEERFAIKDYDLAIEGACEDLVCAMRGRSSPELHLQTVCGHCVWREACTAEALRNDDVSLVPGVPRTYRPSLVSAGLTSVESLAETDPAEAAVRTKLPISWHNHAALSARARMTRAPLRRDSPSQFGGHGAVAISWVTDIFDPSRRIVAVAFKELRATGPVAQPEILIASDHSQSRYLALRLDQLVRDAIDCCHDRTILRCSSQNPLELLTALGDPNVGWLEQSVDLLARCRAAWAFPGEVSSLRDVLAYLDRRVEEPLPYVLSDHDHPSLLYRAYYDVADSGARKRLSQWLQSELAMALQVFERLSDASL